MKKFLVLYKASPAAFAQAMKATPEQQKAGMQEWMAWGQKAASSIVDMGAPLGKSLRVTPTGSSPTSNDLGGYSILQGESKEAIADGDAGPLSACSPRHGAGAGVGPSQPLARGNAFANGQNRAIVSASHRRW